MILIRAVLGASFLCMVRCKICFALESANNSIHLIRYVTPCKFCKPLPFTSQSLWLQRGNYFAETSIRARATISELGARFIRHGSVVMTHAYSRVVLELLKHAVSQVGCLSSARADPAQLMRPLASDMSFASPSDARVPRLRLTLTAWQATASASSPQCPCWVQGVQFSVVITEGRPDETGLNMARALDELRIPVVAILDSGVAYAMGALE